jgi:hypothetical protein
MFIILLDIPNAYKDFHLDSCSLVIKYSESLETVAIPVATTTVGKPLICLFNSASCYILIHNKKLRADQQDVLNQIIYSDWLSDKASFLPYLRYSSYN